MKPTCVRETAGESPRSRINEKSKPGDANPVQLTVTRWEIDSASQPASAKAARPARAANSGAACS